MGGVALEQGDLCNISWFGRLAFSSSGARILAATVRAREGWIFLSAMRTTVVLLVTLQVIFLKDMQFVPLAHCKLIFLGIQLKLN